MAEARHRLLFRARANADASSDETSTRRVQTFSWIGCLLSRRALDATLLKITWTRPSASGGAIGVFASREASLGDPESPLGSRTERCLRVIVAFLLARNNRTQRLLPDRV
jgi:hypothetical protein